MKRFKILLVEDDAGDRRLVEMALARSGQDVGFEVEAAETLSAALELLAAKVYDLVLLDLGLPDSRGVDTVGKICKINLQLPIIVLTGLADEEVGLEAIKKGAEDYLVKGQSLGYLLVRAIRYAIERKRTEQELKAVNAKLKEYDRLKDEFIMNVSHELRTPLTIFRNIVSNALGGAMGKISAKMRENLELAEKSVDRLARIINDFLDISKIESGKMTLNKEVIVIQSIVDEVAGTLQAVAEAKNIGLEAQMPPEELLVNVDRDRIIQVLTNLIANAIKFTPEVDGRINVRVKDLVDEVGVDVEDNGPGIASSDIDTVFSRFVQLEKHIGPGEHGTGLGLTIVKELVELHGGRIWVESRLGAGSNFCFTLPKHVTSRGKSDVSSDESSRASPRTKTW